MEGKSKVSQDQREEIREVRQRVHRFLKDRCHYRNCDVKVERQDGWYVFKGRVSSSGIKARLFGMVPRKHNARRIIDRLHVGRPGRLEKVSQCP